MKWSKRTQALSIPFKFVMQTEHLSFPEAVERLARRYGVKLPPRSPETKKRREAGERQRALLEEAQKFFIGCLEDAEGGEARRELERQRVRLPAARLKGAPKGTIPNQIFQIRVGDNGLVGVGGI